METIKNIKNKIEDILDNSRRFEGVNDELRDYQFQYVEKIENGELKELEELEENDDDENDDGYKNRKKKTEDSLESHFEKKLFKYTSLYGDLWDEYVKRKNKKDIKREQFEEWFKNIFNKINDSYISNIKEWKGDALNILKEDINRIGPITKEYLKEKEKREKEEKKKTIGLINFNLKEVNKLEKFGIETNSQCLEIHFKDLFEQKEKKNNIVNIFSGESLSGLAEIIIDKFPYVKAITARSWIVDSPIGQRVGFNVYNRDNKMEGAFWGQFINEKGEVNKERMQKFLDTGVPEFLPAEGFIKTDDFLEKYLPKEKKGVIELADLSEESLKFREVFKKLEGDNFASISFEEVKSIINENNILSEYIKTPDGINILNMIKIVKDTNAKSLDDIEYPNKDILRKRFGNFIEENKSKYIKRKVLID